jgi:hypothetical protein
MTFADIPFYRLKNQQITPSAFKDPAEVVRWFGAIQAQDYFGALWAIGLRLKNHTESDIEKAIAQGSIIRTWPMRGTLHFTTPEDVRWMLELLAPRATARAAGNYRQAGLDNKLFSRIRKLFLKALEGGNQLTRQELYQVLERAKISTAEQRGLHILGFLAQEGLICFGPRIGKQPSFVLLDEWIPPAKKLDREEALAKLAITYFSSRGPATQQDFAWWSGLTTKDAGMALDLVKNKLTSLAIEKQSYWVSSASPLKRIESPEPGSARCKKIVFPSRQLSLRGQRTLKIHSKKLPDNMENSWACPR